MVDGDSKSKPVQPEIQQQTTDTSAINLLNSVTSRSCEATITPILPVLHGCLLLSSITSFFSPLSLPSHPFFPPPSITIHIPYYRLGGTESHRGPYPSVRDYRIRTPIAGQNILSPRRHLGEMGGPTFITRCQTRPLGSGPSSSGLHHPALVLSRRYHRLDSTNRNSFPALVASPSAPRPGTITLV
ncbi:hypothetical protein M752DRAFT_123876 [Aspergillus phoenicis ATCC 13157]|uniref:Uncharacterized protein n=1 Tax=Aspergillus phoenicis ATCC 13157 TaxID=1353007 RepID=A0A370PUG2_ASPPH|nr:hypothetical protein M752DRAFT_123876 [Aspergillus phoenicis ATCC 13157]